MSLEKRFYTLLNKVLTVSYQTSRDNYTEEEVKWAKDMVVVDRSEGEDTDLGYGGGVFGRIDNSDQTD